MIYMARNTLNDLNNHLFEQIERINDDDLSGEELDQAINKAKVISQLAKGVVNNARVMLDAQKHKDEYYGSNNIDVPDILTIGEEK